MTAGPDAATDLTAPSRPVQGRLGLWTLYSALTMGVATIFGFIAGTPGAIALQLGVAVAGILIALRIAVIDARDLRIPNALTAPMATIIGVGLLGATLITQGWGALGAAAAGAAALGGMHLVLMFFGGGAGDVKLAAIIGFHVAYYDLRLVLVALLGAFLPAAILAAVRIATKRASKKKSLAFGPFLAAGYIVAILAAGVSALGQHLA